MRRSPATHRQLLANGREIGGAASTIASQRLAGAIAVGRLPGAPVRKRTPKGVPKSVRETDQGHGERPK